MSPMQPRCIGLFHGVQNARIRAFRAFYNCGMQSAAGGLEWWRGIRERPGGPVHSKALKGNVLA
jgi:hypothetical protein